MLYLISRSDPWYADIVNFMVTGYVPPGGDKRKLIYESRVHLWDDPYLFRICSDGLLLGILNANRKICKRTDTDVAFTREYSKVSIFHEEREVH
jgi:hypothetical protein